MLIDYALLTGSSYLLYKAIEKLDPAELIASKFKKNDEYCLTLGYRRICGMKVNVIADMRIAPHLLICGLSGTGKSKCVEKALAGKDCILLNAFEDDMPSLKCPRINGTEAMQEYLSDIVKRGIKKEKPFYICIDECLVAASDKKLSKCILDILAIGRHLNTYLVAISQRGTKQDLSYKDLFNSRAVFRMVDPSSYSAVLGSNVDENLQKRQFLLYSDDIYKGRTYDI